jgi:hypothetical protein
LPVNSPAPGDRRSAQGIFAANRGHARRELSFDQLNSVFHELAVGAYRSAGDHEIPVETLLKQLSSRMAAIGCEDALSTTPIAGRR